MTTADDAPVLPGLEFVRPLGRGGYADVFLYEQQRPRMKVAVKILYAEAVATAAAEQFTAEANTMAELAGHPFIVQVFRTDVTEDGRPYLVMKYYPQRNLAVRASAEQLSVPEVLQIGVRISCAVETAHRAGILHRDIKPANILTSQYGEPGLTDFGIATKGPTDNEEAEGLSLPWAPPEIVFGTSPATPASDVYSLGATLWHLLTGHSPFEIAGGDNTTLSVMRRIKEQAVPRTGREDVPAALERLLAQSMAKRPEDRTQSALQFARALQSVESEERWSVTPLVLLEQEPENGIASPHPNGGGDGPIGSVDTAIDEVGGRTATRPPRVAAHGDGGEERTRRRPQVVHADDSDGGPEHGKADTPRSRVGMPAELPATETVRRPSVVRPVGEPDPASVVDVNPASAKRKVLGGVLLGVIVIGVAVLVSLLGQHAGSTSGTSLPTAPNTGPTIVTPSGDGLSNGSVQVAGGVATFNWSQPLPLPSGSIVGWRKCNSTDSPRVIPGPPLSVPNEPNLCVAIYLHLASGEVSAITIPVPS